MPQSAVCIKYTTVPKTKPLGTPKRTGIGAEKELSI